MLSEGGVVYICSGVVLLQRSRGRSRRNREATWSCDRRTDEPLLYGIRDCSNDRRDVGRITIRTMADLCDSTASRIPSGTIPSTQFARHRRVSQIAPRPEAIETKTEKEQKTTRINRKTPCPAQALPCMLKGLIYLFILPTFPDIYDLSIKFNSTRTFWKNPPPKPQFFLAFNPLFEFSVS